MATSITLRRELVDAILFKFSDPCDRDDTQWPSETVIEKQTVTRARNHLKTKESGKKGLFAEISDDEEKESSPERDQFQRYWSHILRKYQNMSFIQPENSSSDIDALPDNWMVLSISLTEDKTALLISRQRPKHEPIVLYIPLKGRREEDSEEHFAFEDATSELQDILQQSRESTKQVSQIKSDDKEAKAEWWAQRKVLDLRMKELLENIEFCWLGAFKVRCSFLAPYILV